MSYPNYGIVNPGSMAAGGNIVAGQGNVVSHGASTAAGQPHKATGGVCVGVLTVLSVETAAMVEAMKQLEQYQPMPPNGTTLHQATMVMSQRRIEIVAMQLTGQGQQAAVAGLAELLKVCSPFVAVVVGIAGGIHPDVALGDVVIADQAISYDLRKETNSGTVRRGRTHSSGMPVPRQLNNFFSRHGEPYLRHDPAAPGKAYQVHRGPVGSGDAVVAGADAEIRQYLRAFNDKVLAVEMEIGGVAHASYENGGQPPWLTVRGISDRADEHKHDRDQTEAARRAVAVLMDVIPYLSSLY